MITAVLSLLPADPFVLLAKVIIPGILASGVTVTLLLRRD